ncbi:MAG: beta-lactamase family protein [Leptolyngbya sp. SIO1D8]|nr:beta-lactamase family protein [Leptolyngbya sp. SIO1D8]
MVEGQVYPPDQEAAILTISIEADIEALVNAWIAHKEHMNVVVGVIQGGDRWVKGWNAATSSSATDLETDLPDGNTLFEIGSITKVFTATLLSLLVENQRLSLETPVNRLGSIYQQLPDTVTLESLATHTSGLPRLPDNLQKSFTEDRQNPYAAYSFEDLHEYLQNQDRQPGETTGTISYSNLAAGVLGNILADHCGQSYEEAIVQRICQPLGLQDTRITLSDKQQVRFVMGYSEDGKPAKPWDLPALAGAGALRSTANDLLTFLAAHLQPEQTSIAQVLLNTHPLRHQTFAQTKGFQWALEKGAKWIRTLRGDLLAHQETGVALGWFMETLPNINRCVYTHAGGTGGYRSFCGFIKETQTGVVVLSNYGELLAQMFGRYSIGNVGLKILELASTTAPQREIQRAGIGVQKSA